MKLLGANQGGEDTNLPTSRFGTVVKIEKTTTLASPIAGSKFLLIIGAYVHLICTKILDFKVIF